MHKISVKGFLAVISTSNVLLCQDLAIRGRTDDNSNFHQIIKDKSSYCPGLKLLMTENKYLSHDCLDELQQFIVLNAQRQLVASIKRGWILLNKFNFRFRCGM